MKKFILLITVYLLVSCSSPNKIPDDVIGINKMKLIVWDLTCAGKLAQIEYERTHRINFAKSKPALKDSSLAKKNKRSDSTYRTQDTSALKKDTMSLKMLSTKAFQQVFDLYHITKEEFYKSYRYYEEHPDKNNILMDSLSAYSGRQRQELYKKMQ